MKNESKRIVVASVLIFFVLLLQPYYLEWLGVSSDSIETEVNQPAIQADIYENNVLEEKALIDTPLFVDSSIGLELYSVSTPLYSISIGNSAGGTILSSSLLNTSDGDSRLTGGLDQYGVYQYDIPVFLSPLNDSSCAPCLAYYDYSLDEYKFFNMPFKLITPLSSNNLSLSLDESFVMEFVYDSDGLIIKKTLTFSGNTYILNIDYSIHGPKASEYSFEIFWSGIFNVRLSKYHNPMV